MKLRVGCLILILTVTGLSLYAAEIEPDIDGFAGAVKVATKERIDGLQTIAHYSTSRQTKVQVAKELADLRSGKQYALPQLSWPPKPGQIGSIPREVTNGKVEQVIGKSKLLIYCKPQVSVVMSSPIPGGNQVGHTAAKSYVIDGISTAGVLTGGTPDWPRLVYMSGTSNFGGETIPVFRVIDQATIDEATKLKSK